MNVQMIKSLRKSWHRYERERLNDAVSSRYQSDASRDPLLYKVVNHPDVYVVIQWQARGGALRNLYLDNFAKKNTTQTS